MAIEKMVTAREIIPWSPTIHNGSHHPQFTERRRSTCPTSRHHRYTAALRFTRPTVIYSVVPQRTAYYPASNDQNRPLLVQDFTTVHTVRTSVEPRTDTTSIHLWQALDAREHLR